MILLIYQCLRKRIFYSDDISNCLHNIISNYHRQGLAVLMASAVVVLKHETSTLRQMHNFILIDLNNTETVGDTRNMSMNHDYETGVALSDSVIKTCVKRP